MINYKLKKDQRIKMRDLIFSDYEVQITLFKNEISFKDYISDLYLHYKNNKDQCLEDYEDQIIDNEYYIYIVLLSNLITIEKMKKDFKKDFTVKNCIYFKDNFLNIQYLKRYNSIYLIIDNILPVFINKDNVIGSISISENKLWYSYLNSLDEYYINIDSMRDYKDFISTIENYFNPIVNLPKINKSTIENLYLEYFNNFLTVDSFAAYNDFTIDYATRIISIGRKLNHLRGV